MPSNWRQLSMGSVRLLRVLLELSSISCAARCWTEARITCEPPGSSWLVGTKAVVAVAVASVAGAAYGRY